MSSKYEIEPRLQDWGDHSDTEGILRFRRIRVERQEVLLGDSLPMMCLLGDDIIVAGQRGGLVKSADGGRSWSTMRRFPGMLPDDRVYALGVDGNRLMVALSTEDELSIRVSDDGGLTFSSSTTMDAPDGAGDLPGRFLTGEDGIRLFLNTAIFASKDHAESWSKLADLPPGWSHLRPTVLSDGTWVGAVLIEESKDDICHTFFVRSPDGGRTWQDPRCVTRRGEISGDVHELSHGRLVLTYGQQTNPYGARAIVSPDGGKTWDNRIYVLAVGRWGGATRQPRPRECHPASGIASTIGSDGVLLSAFDRGQTIRPSDGVGQQTAIGVVRWTTDGFERPALSYPSLWTDKTDKDGYLSNGLVRMRPDDRFEGGDYIDPYEMVTCRRLPAEQRHFPDMGNKGTVVCRHPGGSLWTMSRDPVLFRSTDDGRTWQRAAEIERIGHNPDTFGFGITSRGTLLVSHSDRMPGAADPAYGYVARSEDGGRSWQHIQLDPSPACYVQGGEANRTIELTDGTLLLVCDGWIHHERKGYVGEVLLRSSDDGRTWGDPTVMPPGFCESNMLELPSGMLLMATRYQRWANMDDLFRKYTTLEKYSDLPLLLEDGTWDPPSRNQVGWGRFKNEAILLSHDRGYNWTTPTFVTRMHGCSADVVLLPDGKIVLTYDEKDGVSGSRALVSTDGGATWEPEIYVLRWGHSGRTSSVALLDGSVLTLLAGNDGLGTRATVWRPE